MNIIAKHIDMENSLSLKISRKFLNKALRVLSPGFKYHKKYAETYVIAFRVDTKNMVSVLVPGGEYTIEAETSGNGCFALNFKKFKMLINDCKSKYINLNIEGNLLTLNRFVSVKIKLSEENIDIPLSLTYTSGELARLDLTKLDKKVIDFWGLTTQIEDAKDEVENAIEKAFIQLAKYLPPKLTSSEFKAILRKELIY